MKPGEMLTTIDHTIDFNELLKKFKNEKVLVGIPQENSSRSDDSDINNATLLAINNFGSPAHNIPARPVMEIGIRNAQDDIADEFKKAAQTALQTGTKALDVYYERAGMIAANSVKKAINDQDGIAAPSPVTLYLRQARGFKGTKALIVTGAMRNAITYQIRGNS